MVTSCPTLHLRQLLNDGAVQANSCIEAQGKAMVGEPLVEVRLFLLVDMEGGLLVRCTASGSFALVGLLERFQVGAM